MFSFFKIPKARRGDLFSNNNKYNTSGRSSRGFERQIHVGPLVEAYNPGFFFSSSSLIVFLRLRREFPLFSQLLPTIFKISKNTKIQDALLLTSFRGGPATIDITNTIPCWCRPAPSVCSSETYRRLLCDLNSWEGEKEKEVEEE